MQSTDPPADVHAAIIKAGVHDGSPLDFGNHRVHGLPQPWVPVVHWQPSPPNDPAQQPGPSEWATKPQKAKWRAGPAAADGSAKPPLLSLRWLTSPIQLRAPL